MKNVLLLLVGGAMMKIVLDDSYLRYVKSTAAVPVLLAGAAMAGLAVVGMVQDSNGHQHSRFAAWLLVLPVLAIFGVAPPALGADAVVRAGNPPIARNMATFAPLPRSGVVAMPLSEFVARAVWDSGSLDGRQIELTGFVVHEGNANYVARLVISCCAADAEPMKVALTGGRTDQLPDDQWVRVTGVLQPGSSSASNGYTPTLAVTALMTVNQPRDPYEY